MKAVIFDMDGIIFDSERLVLECWQKVALKYGIEDIDRTCRSCIGINRRASEINFRARYGDDFDYKKYRGEVTELFQAAARNGGLALKTGVHELLAYLKDCGIPAAVASSTNTETVVSELTQAGLSGYFKETAGGDNVKNSKPAPDIFLYAAERLGTAPEDCLVIEDSYNGIRAAASAGMHCIMVPDMLPPNEEMYAAADAVLGTLLEVKEYLGKH